MQDWEYPATTHFAQLSANLRIAYTDQGSGPTTLLFIHGMGSYLRAWDKTVAVLRDHYRCIALDLPGYGKSSQGPYPGGLPIFAETVQQFMRHLFLHEVVLVGHSMGGQIAVHTVLQDRSRISKLVLLAPAGLERFTRQDARWLRQLYTPALLRAMTREQITLSFELNFYDMPDDARFMIEDRLRLRRTAAYDTYTQMIAQCLMGMLDAPVFDRLPEVHLPTLLVFGQDDQLIPNKLLHPTLTTEAVARAGAAQLPYAQWHLLPRAGHFVQWDQASAVNTLIHSFVAR